MAIARGTRFGSYEVAALIGVGGMGEVYRAHDTSLKRDVALKVLPEELLTDANRLARLQREAEFLASLNHANVAHIYGLERSDGRTALVMELIDGITLAERIAQGPLPSSEALDVAMQIAAALEAAHERGIVHRDLKPANIKLKDDGTVKVLDFGIAKALDLRATSGPRRQRSTTPAMTEVGVMLGTAAYMSPEQARGKAVDTAHRHLGVRLRALRDARWAAGVRAKVCRTHWRAASSVSQTGRACQRSYRLRCAPTSNAACRKIPDSACRPLATSGLHWRARSTRLCPRLSLQVLRRSGGASCSPVLRRWSRAARLWVR